MKKVISILSFFLVLLEFGCNTSVKKAEPDEEKVPQTIPALSLENANKLSKLPFKCMDTEYPNTMQQTLYSAADIKTPKEAHPTFYGCFDWHSSVHGHWSLVKLLKQFPDLANAGAIRQKLTVNLNEANVNVEVKYLQGKRNKAFERTYGWAWLLKLAEELHTWNDPLGKKLEHNLQPLTNQIIRNFMQYLPELDKPVRSGLHPNTAFGLSFAWDYAVTTGNDSLKTMIAKRARDFYQKDSRYNISREPEGADILSPGLEEVDIMRRVLSESELKAWLGKFLPELKEKSFKLAPGKVSDRTDGHLGHIDGLNFSRAWCLLGLANAYPGYEHLRPIAYSHINYSLPSLVGGDGGNYDASGHWLGSFAIYALNSIPGK